MQPHHRRAVLWVIVATQVCLALATAAGVVLVYRHLDGNITPGADIVNSAEKRRYAGDGEPLNIVLMGTDTRCGAGNRIDEENADCTEHSDTTILLHVAADRRSAYGVSLPRDAIVDRPACQVDGRTIPPEEETQFNVAYDVGGPGCTATLVSALTGVYIDHYLSIDFNGFREMVDAIGGVTVCLPEQIRDEDHGIVLPEGTHVFNGEQALSYVRVRHGVGDESDIGRMRRQQAFLASLVNQVRSAGTLTRMDRVTGFLSAMTDSLETDPQLARASALARLALELRRIDVNQIQFLTVPWEPYPADPDVFVQWAPEADRIWRRINQDAPLPPGLTEEAISAGQPPGVTPSVSPPGAPPSAPAASPGTGATATPEQDTAEQTTANRRVGLCT